MLGRRKLNSKAKAKKLKRPDHFNTYDEVEKFLREYFKREHWLIKHQPYRRRIEVLFDFDKADLDSRDPMVVFAIDDLEVFELTKKEIKLKLAERLTQLTSIFRFDP